MDETRLDQRRAQDYLDRIGMPGPASATGAPEQDLQTLTDLQRAHLSTVPFENIAVWRGEPVRTDTGWSIPKIVDRGQGGWCFELNGAFAVLLEHLGFQVRRLGAAVLLEGPNKLIDHATLEVQLDQPYLVDVGFGESFITPLRLNDRDPQDGGIAHFQFFDSAEGLTLTKLEPQEDGTAAPVPQYRFRRVTLQMPDFDGASDRLRSDPDLHWSAKPFATRLVDGGPERITLLKDWFKQLHRDGTVTESPVAAEDWDKKLAELFRPA